MLPLINRVIKLIARKQKSLARIVRAQLRAAKYHFIRGATVNTKKVNEQMLARLHPIYTRQETRIPKIIHYCWVGGKNKPEDIERYIESWKTHLPDFEIIEWNESNFDLHLNMYSREAYDSKKWAFVSDVVRLYALYTYGGIYLDADVEILKPIDGFLNHAAFTSFETPSISGRDPFIPTGLMGSEKNGAWVKDLLDTYESRSFILPDGSFDLLPNPKPITYLTADKYGLIRNDEFQDLGAVAVYPNYYFCAKDWLSGAVTITPDTYAIHHFSGSWK